MSKSKIIRVDKPFVFTLSKSIHREPTPEEIEDFPDGVQEILTTTYSTKMPFGRESQLLFSGVVANILEVFYSEEMNEFREQLLKAIDSLGQNAEVETVGQMLQPFIPLFNNLDPYIDAIAPYVHHFTTISDPSELDEALAPEIWMGIIGSMIWIYKQMSRMGMLDALKKSLSGLTTHRSPLEGTATALIQ